MCCIISCNDLNYICSCRELIGWTRFNIVSANYVQSSIKIMLVFKIEMFIECQKLEECKKKITNCKSQITAFKIVI
jgi:hypothetical protein